MQVSVHVNSETIPKQVANKIDKIQFKISEVAMGEDEKEKNPENPIVKLLDFDASKPDVILEINDTFGVDKIFQIQARFRHKSGRFGNFCSCQAFETFCKCMAFWLVLTFVPIREMG